MNGWTDEDILSGLRRPAHRREAFLALKARYGAPLLGFLKGMCRHDPESAEDLLLTVFHKALTRLPLLEGECSLKSWLFTVARNSAVDHLRGENRSTPDGRPLPLSDDLADSIPSPSPRISGKERKRARALGSVLAKVGEKDGRYRTLLEMVASGCDRDEMAGATGIEKKQLSQYIKRAKDQFLKYAREHEVLAELQETGNGD